MYIQPICILHSIAVYFYFHNYYKILLCCFEQYKMVSYVYIHVKTICISTWFDCVVVFLLCQVNRKLCKFRIVYFVIMERQKMPRSSYRCTKKRSPKKSLAGKLIYARRNNAILGQNSENYSALVNVPSSNISGQNRILA